MRVFFNDEFLYIQFEFYLNGKNIGLNLMDNEGFPVTRATTVLPNGKLSKFEVAVKTHSENEGLYDALLEAGIIEPSHRIEVSGGVDIPICNLTDDFIEWGKVVSSKFEEFCYD
jgi:hypothetical protein